MLLVLLQLMLAQGAWAAAMLSPYGATLGNITDTDDSFESVSLTGVFSNGINFGGTNYTSMSVGSNGYVTFGHDNNTYSPLGIAGYSLGPIVAVQFDDLHPGTCGDIYYNQNVAENYVVVTFDAVCPFSTPTSAGAGANTMQIVLRRIGAAGSTDFSIELRYGTLQWAGSGNNGGAFPTAGWSSGNGTAFGETPSSGTSSFLNSVNQSNIGQPGVFSWDVTGGVVQSQPTVNQTTAASGITGSTANSGGNVSSDGASTVTERGVVYSTSPSPTTANSKATTSGTTGSFSVTLTGLSPGTTYYARAYAINAIGTGYGPQVQFTTLSQTAPTVSSTTAASAIAADSASSGGNVSSDGGAAITQRGVAYATTTNPTTSNSVVTAAGTTGAFSSSLTGLSPNTTYYARAFATNAVGTSYGNQISFTTLKFDQTISFSDPGVQTYSVGGSFTASATASSGLPVTITSATTGTCTVNATSPATVMIVGAGTCTLNANQGGNGSYNAAPQASLGVTINPAPTVTTVLSTSVGAEALTNQGFSVDVQVAGADPTGDVTVYARRADNGTVASCVATLGAHSAGIASGSCSFPPSTLKPRDLVTQLVASYPGDLTDASSTSSSFAFNVARGDVAISSVVVDTSGDRDAVSGEPITVTVSLAAVGPALGPVTGDGIGAPDVTIATSESGTGCSIDWDMATSCSFVFTGVSNTSQLLRGLDDADPKLAAAAKAALLKTLTVSYAQTVDFNASGPTAADPVTVSSAPTATVLLAESESGNPNSVAGEGVRLSATVTALAPSVIPPRGRVRFTRDSTVLGTVTVSAAAGNTATAEFIAPARPVGSEIYYAFFLSNDDFVGSDDDAEHTTVQASTATMIDAVVPAT
ncbi:beta strand repeat-containing protein, partial [Aquimonas voraii]